jgi:hypothetical protein
MDLLHRIGLAVLAVFAFGAFIVSFHQPPDVVNDQFSQSNSPRTVLDAPPPQPNVCKFPQETGSLPHPNHSDSPCNLGMFGDMQDGSMRSYNIIIKPQDLAILDAAPMAEKYVPCDFVANYNPSNTSILPAEHPDRVATVIGVRCRYKGSSGSFEGCINSTTGNRIPPNPARNCKLSWKINLKKGKLSGMPVRKFSLDSFQVHDAQVTRMCFWDRRLFR